MSSLSKICAYLDVVLKPSEFKDSSHNGLQVENSGVVKCICTGVDAAPAFFEAAAERGANLLICHHGLSWGDSLKRISGLNYRRLKFLIEHDMALYACHLPLDAHPQLGNNALICRAFGLRRREPFGIYHGIPLGFRGHLPRAMPYAAFKRRAAAVFGRKTINMDFGGQTVRTVAVVSGGAAELIGEAAEKDTDVYISGEPQLTAYNLAQEYGIHAIFAGHYPSEVFGVRALAARLQTHFQIPAEFIDMGIRF